MNQTSSKLEPFNYKGYHQESETTISNERKERQLTEWQKIFANHTWLKDWYVEHIRNSYS